MTVQGPVREQQPDGMSHGGSGGGDNFVPKFSVCRQVAKFRGVGSAAKMPMSYFLHTDRVFFNALVPPRLPQRRQSAFVTVAFGPVFRATDSFRCCEPMLAGDFMCKPL